MNDGNWYHVAVTYDPKDTLDYPFEMKEPRKDLADGTRDMGNRKEALDKR